MANLLPFSKFRENLTQNRPKVKTHLQKHLNDDKFRENLITFGQTNLINKSAWFRKEQEKNDIHTVTSNNYAYEVEKTNPLQTYSGNTIESGILKQTIKLMFNRTI